MVHRTPCYTLHAEVSCTTSRRVITSNEPCLSSCEPQIINNIQFPLRCLGDNKSDKYLNPKCCLCYQWKTFNGVRTNRPSIIIPSRGNLLELQDDIFNVLNAKYWSEKTSHKLATWQTDPGQHSN